VAQVVEHLPSKCEALDSTTSTTRKKERKKTQTQKIKHQKNIPINKWAAEQFSNEKIQMTIMKKCSKSLAVGERQIKTVRIHLIPVRLG
jgi:hypothetical protein